MSPTTEAHCYEMPRTISTDMEQPVHAEEVDRQDTKKASRGTRRGGQRVSEIDELIGCLPESVKNDEFYNSYSNDRVLEIASNYIIDIQGELEELKAENEELRAIIENIQIESEKLNDYNLVHRVKSLQNIIALYYLKIKKEVSE